MKKLLFLLLALLCLGIGRAWADSTWYITSEDLTADSWTAMADATPAGVTALGSYTAYYKTESVTLESAGSIEVRFKYTSGYHRLDILGVDVLDADNNVVATDYHFGYTGTAMDKNTYLLNALSAGSYTLRYIISGNLSNSAGNITLNTIKYADSFANIAQWYVVRIHGNQAHYMYYNTSNAETGISFTSSTADISTDNYLWGFVKNGNGVSIYNKAAGSTLALDDATPSTMSADGTSVAFTLGTTAAGTNGWDADAFFSVYQTAGTYLNYQGDLIKRWTAADEGSTFMINAVEAPTTLTYTLTDENDAQYTGSYTGMAGMTEPTLTGCAGYTLTDASWSGTEYSATINFPFTVSSKGQTNWTYIGNFNDANFYWFVEGTDATKVYVNAGSPNITHDKYQRYQWAIEPTISGSNITFKIKNCTTGTYVTSSSTTTSHSGAVTLTEEGTGLTYILDGSYYRWCLPTTTASGGKLELSINSSTATVNQELGTYTVHNGTAIKVADADDFATLIANLNTALSAYGTFKNTHTIGTGLGQYNGDTYDDMEAAVAAAQNANSKFTAAQLTTYATALENPETKLTLNLPSAGFYRIKGYSGNYITSNTANNNAAMNGTASANNILYYSSEGNLIFYGSGLGLYGTHTVAPVGSTLNTFTFSQGAQPGKYYITSNATGAGTYCYDNTSNGTKLDRNGSAVTSGSYQTDWTPESVNSLPVTFKGEYASFYSPVNLTIPEEGVEVYTGQLNGEWLTLNAVEGTLPANTGVILRRQSEETTTVNFPVLTTANEGTSSLTGTVAAKTVEASSVLVLGKNGDDWGLYTFTGTTLGGFKAYMEKSGGDVKGIRFNFGDTLTGIEAAEVAGSLNGAIYNLAGQRVQQPVRGLYIVGGRKVVIK